MKIYSLVMLIICGLFFGMASLGTIGDLAAVLGGPGFALEGTEARLYSDFDFFKGSHRNLASGGLGDRMVMADEGDMRAQWQGYRERAESRHGETTARELLTSLVMFVVFGALFIAHYYAFQAYSVSAARGRVARRVKVASKPARVRKLRAKSATRKRATVTKRPTRKAA